MDHSGSGGDRDIGRAAAYIDYHSRLRVVLHHSRPEGGSQTFLYKRDPLRPNSSRSSAQSPALYSSCQTGSTSNHMQQSMPFVDTGAFQELPKHLLGHIIICYGPVAHRTMDYGIERLSTEQSHSA